MLVLTLIYSEVVIIHNIGCETKLSSLPFRLSIVALKAGSFSWTHTFPKDMAGEPEPVHDARIANFVTDVATVAGNQVCLVLSSNIV